MNIDLQLHGLNDEEKKTIVNEMDADLRHLYYIGEIFKKTSSLPSRKRRRSIDPAPPKVFRLEDCPWSLYMSPGPHSDDNSTEGKEFRRRFRVPWSFYDDLLQRIRSDDRLSVLRTKKDG